MRRAIRCGLWTVIVLAATPILVGQEQQPNSPQWAVAGPKPQPIAPPTAEALNAAIERGVAFLLGVQNKDGSWGSAHQTKRLNIYAPVPGAHHGFRAAVTSLCVSALIETGGDGEEVQHALERGEQWMFKHLPDVRRATPEAIYNNWAHAFAIQTLVRIHPRSSASDERRRQIKSLIQQQIEMLARYESVDGGWGYYDFRAGTQKPASFSNSFLTATVLVALDDARHLGIQPPEKLVRRAIASIHRQRKADFSYLYSERLKWWPMTPINRRGSSLGRSQACNLALRVWGDEHLTDQVLKTWLDRLFARNLWLDIGRKRPVPHESWFGVAGYFFYYGHYYAALCIDQLEPEDRSHFQHHLAHILTGLQEKDGSWWDFPLYNYHQQYGTAMALMSLVRCRNTDHADRS